MYVMRCVYVYLCLYVVFVYAFVRSRDLRSISQEAQSLHTSGEETRSILIDFNTEMTRLEDNERVRFGSII